MAEALDTKEFNRSLSRTFTLPLGLAVVLGISFTALVFHLISVAKWVDHSHEVVGRANHVLKLFVDAETGVRGFTITRRENFLEPYNSATASIENELTNLIDFVSDNPSQVARVKAIQARYVDWSKFAAETVEKARFKTKSAESAIESERGKHMMDDLRAKFDGMIAAENKLLAERTEETQNNVRLALILILSGSILFGALLAFYGRKQLLAVSETYKNALDVQTTQNQKLQDQDWLRKGQTVLAELTRGDQSLQEIASSTLRFLADYLNAYAATFYAVEERGGLTLLESYALSSEDHQKAISLQPGESLVGQVLKENRVLVLNEPPKDYFKVQSSLGAAVPSQALIFPATVGSEVRAVIELAFLGGKDARRLELIEIISESIGVSVKSAQYRTKLQDLLEESQRQAEELQAQQEELRVNNEELEEQSNALKESQTKLESQQAELEQTNTQLGYQAKALERQNDELNSTRDVLEKKARELELASQYKSQFLANMSHELRTPLNSTLILAQLLAENKEGRLSADDIEFAKTIVSSSNDLLSLINDILDLSKVESGKIELQVDAVPISDFVENIRKTFLHAAVSGKVEMKYEIDASAPAIVETDKLRLEQIIKNFISNALKFTNKGTIRLKVRSVDSNQIAFEVSDTGIGIKKDRQDIIFEAFQQADGTTSRKYGGTGLGLTISRDLARLMGGKIELASEEGKGSTFSLILPLKFEQKTQPSTSSSHLTEMEFGQSVHVLTKKIPSTTPEFLDDRGHLKEGARILLVVEDDSVFARILLELSHEMKFQCLVAQTAEQAFQLATQYIPDAVILDLKLPDHSGLLVLDRLKESPLLRHIPVHIISSADFTKTALQMGAVGYLLKPTDRKKILDVMGDLEKRITQATKRVLVIEDNPVQRVALKKLLAQDSTEVVTAESGDEALTMMKSQRIDCIVLDLNLPGMSGYELLEKMSNSSEMQPPVIIYTGRSLSRDEEDRLRRYSRSIILKGAKSPERLLNEVTLFLHQMESKLPPESQRKLKEFRDRERIFEGKHILLVDDDVRNIFALNNALQPRGAKTEIARNGLEALEKLKQNPKMDLVLMDIMMPEMDGYQATREIRKNPIFAKLPIIAVTAKAMSDDQEKCMQAGASDYLPKPIDLQQLISLIRVWLHPSEKF